MVKSYKVDSIVVVELENSIIGNSESVEINQIFTQHIEEGFLKFVVDLSKVNIMNSSGLGTLIAGLTAIKKRNGILKVAGANNQIQQLLKVTKLDSVFELNDTLEKTLKIFSESSKA
jgi:anti-sigma B factor antagonist